MRMPGVAPGAAARALLLCVTGEALRWVVDTAGRPHQQSCTGWALARADSAIFRQLTKLEGQRGIPPGPDMRMPGVAPGAAAQVSPLLRNRRRVARGR